MKSFLYLTVFLLCSLIHASLALSSSKLPPKSTVTYPSKSTSTVSLPPKTTTTFPSKSTTTSSVTLPPKTTAKCIPVTVTVTEKVKTTIRETVTVTVNAGPSNVNDQNCADKWAQCGGIGFNGPTCCKSGSTCQQINQYYSQCV